MKKTSLTLACLAGTTLGLNAATITVNFDQRVSSSASRYYRFQYSGNGTDFVNCPVISLSGSNAFLAQAILLKDVPEATENVHFAFRLVSEFESTATGAGADRYLTTSTAPYSASGT